MKREFQKKGKKRIEEKWRRERNRREIRKKGVKEKKKI